MAAPNMPPVTRTRKGVDRLSQVVYSRGMHWRFVLAVVVVFVLAEVFTALILWYWKGERW